MRKPRGGWNVRLAELADEAPESVTRAMIQAKLDQLSDDERRLLLAARVQGMDVDSAVSARALGEDAANIEVGLDAVQSLRGPFEGAGGNKRLPDGTLTATRYPLLDSRRIPITTGTLRFAQTGAPCVLERRRRGRDDRFSWTTDSGGGRPNCPFI